MLSYYQRSSMLVSISVMVITILLEICKTPHKMLLFDLNLENFKKTTDFRDKEYESF